MIFIIYTIAALILVVSAAICSAKMDNVDDHWYASIYNKDDYDSETWYNSNKSWELKKPEYKSAWQFLAKKFMPFWIKPLMKIKPQWDPISDFWHFEKSKMIVWIALSGSLTFLAGFKLPYYFSMQFSTAYLIAVGWILLVAIAWNLAFGYYYNRKLVRKGFKKRWLWLKADTSV